MSGRVGVRKINEGMQDDHAIEREFDGGGTMTTNNNNVNSKQPPRGAMGK